MRKLTLAVLAASVAIFGGAAGAQDLKGSRASMQRQNLEAVRLGYTFISTSREVGDLVGAGRLVKIEAGRHYDLHQVSFPYALPEVGLFLERLSALYHVECGEKLTVTSLMRPQDRQPVNASEESVHPTGMALDLRVPSKSRCRNWLESTLLSLEGAEVLDVTRERNPPHYHVAIFPETYALYAQSEPVMVLREYVVRRGDTLSGIAARTGVTVARLRAANGLRGDLIRPGQKLLITPAEAGARTVAMNGEAEAAAQLTHQVRRGDTLWRIARRYGTTVEALQRENGLSGDFLKVGMSLQVTVSGGAL